MRLIIPADEVALIEVARVKSGRSDWLDALEAPVAAWRGAEMAQALELIERLPEGEAMRCFFPGFGIRLHDGKVARVDVLFCFDCHLALMIDLLNPDTEHVGEAFEPDSDPGRELLSRFRSCAVA